ncbi:alpha/beta hydrolase [Paenibacillus gansuensis]|uniref:Alpha/beta fold hydrolase n=1 Tax=Paenibacillus gansuensis TaxID=306542 RepID=A0ABW5PHZ5_9BACL
MNLIKGKKMIVLGLAAVTLLGATLVNNQNIASAGSKETLVPVHETLVKKYKIISPRIGYNTKTGYIQIDGQDAFKAKKSANGNSYVAPETIKAAVEKIKKSEKKLTFVLVHGAWADASFFDETAAELRQQGHTVYVPEYPGHGSLKDMKNATHEQMTNAVADYIKKKNLTNIVLLGHSFGGTIIAKVSEQIPERISRLVFFDAFVPLDGESLADQLPAPVQQSFAKLAEDSKDGTIMLPFPLFREAFANTASLEEAKAMYANISPEPAGPLVQKLNLKKFYSLQIPKSYLYLTEDNVLPQNEDFSWHPKQSGRLGFFRYIEGRGDHMTTVHKEPEEIAEKFVQAGRE